MICPICRNKVPFGIEMHMLAAHGAKSAEYQRETKRIEKALVPQPKKRSYGGHKRKKSGTQGQLQHPRLSKLS